MAKMLTRADQLKGMVDDALASPTDECVIWPHGKDGDGYGIVRHPSLDRPTRAHRVACERAHGPAPKGKQALHSCHDRACVNPAHLRWGTPGENSKDMVKAGRSLRGVANSQVKLTREQVLEIRALEGEMFQREIAEMYGVARRTISDIMVRRTWRHV